MNLTIDIGNTRSKLAIFHQKKILKKANYPNPLDKERLLLFLKDIPTKTPKNLNVILSATSEIDKSLEKYLQDHFFYINLSAETDLPIQNHYKTPKTLGKDRIAAAVGAQVLYPKENCLVVDAGTCITYELVSAKGIYLGGNISPGIDMRLQAMNHFTAKLPLVKKQRLDTNIGYNTETALRVGGQLGTIQEIKGFIQLYNEEYPKLHVLFTGGDAAFLGQQFDNVVINNDLVLIGLNEILKYNVNKQ